MKHIIKSNKWARAWCERPGCIASVEGWVKDWTQEQLDNFFTSDCPSVWADGKGAEMSEKDRKDYLIKHANKEIKDWKKLIKYWESQ